MDNDLRKSTGEILKMLRQTADNQEFCQNILATKVKKRVTLQKNRKR